MAKRQGSPQHRALLRELARAGVVAPAGGEIRLNGSPDGDVWRGYAVVGREVDDSVFQADYFGTKFVAEKRFPIVASNVTGALVSVGKAEQT